MLGELEVLKVIRKDVTQDTLGTQGSGGAALLRNRS